MPLMDWFRRLGLANEAQDYKSKFIDAEIPDDETKLPRLGLTRDDLAALRIKLIHRQTILDGIREVERGGEILPEDRKDFIRRLFAVAISVGFAARLVHMPWIDQPDKWLDSDQTLELVRLATGIFVVVSGWEWYHRDLKDRPLKYPLRFYLDVAIVIYTIVFLYSSTKEGVWLFSLVVIFIGYVFWDLLSMRDYPTDSRNFVAGLLTNILWLVYFIFIFLMNNQHPFITCAFVFLGAIALRALGSSRVAQADTWQGFLFRLVVVLALAGAYYIAPFVPGFV